MPGDPPLKTTPVLVASVFAIAALAGCLRAEDEGDQGGDVGPPLPERDGLGRTVHRYLLEAADGVHEFVLNLTSGGLSRIAPAEPLGPEGVWYRVQLPEGWYTLAEARWGPNEARAEGPLDFLVPPGTTELNVSLNIMGEGDVSLSFPLERVPAALFLSGANILELYEIHRDEYRDRRPSAPNYTKAQDFYAKWFADLGYDVERDPYGLTAYEDVRTPTSSRASPASAANVVAYKRGSLVPERIIAFGGHYDTVENTHEGAWDNLAGTVATLELARAFAGLETDYSLLFGLWGGEEDGLLGSNFWVRGNPDKVAAMTAYVNLDVFGFAYPGPLGAPDPVLFSAGPDGPIGEYLLERAAAATALAGIPPALVKLEQVGAGQASAVDDDLPVQPFGDGAGINAQSDHTSFISEGVPSYMVSTGNIAAVFALPIHQRTDTIHNLTYYLATGDLPDRKVQPNLTAEELATGRLLVAQSFEHQLFSAFYIELFAERGEFSPPVRG